MKENMDKNENPKYAKRFLALAIVLCLTFIGSLFVGRYSLGFHSLLLNDLGTTIILNVRLPRILSAVMLGMALSVSGTVLQSAFKNPLVGPEILGVSQGAAFGAAFAILFLPRDPITIEVLSMVFGLLALLASYGISSAIKYGGRILKLVLAGLAVSAMFSGGVGIMKCLADPLKQLPELTFWLLGGLSGVTWRDLLYMTPLTLAGITLLLIARWRINLLTLEDDTIISLGTDPGKLRALVVTSAVITTSAVTSVSGIIGWVGLTIPHMTRKMFGAENSVVIPASTLLGATLVVIFDDIARTVSASEIPLGIVTSILGATLFLLMLSRGGINE